jgi:hypothetical protein
LHPSAFWQQRSRRIKPDRLLDPLTFLDLDKKLVAQQLAREKARRRSGPVAENLLRDIGVVGARNY